ARGKLSGWIAPSGRDFRVANCLCENDHTAQFAPCIASRWEQSNPDNFPRARHTARFEKFGEVELDFTGVESIGQAFADELLRVWPLAHPQTKLFVTNANNAVLKMVGHVKGRSDLPQVSGTDMK
ncbi:MAG: STAS-like domain-containing protein, partial [Sulfuricellaceae bacterium]